MTELLLIDGPDIYRLPSNGERVEQRKLRRMLARVASEQKRLKDLRKAQEYFGDPLRVTLSSCGSSQQVVSPLRASIVVA